MSIVDSGWNIDDFGAVGKRVYELQTLAFATQLQGNVLLSGITGIQTEQNPLKKQRIITDGLEWEKDRDHQMVLLQGTLWTQKSSMRWSLLHSKESTLSLFFVAFSLGN